MNSFWVNDTDTVKFRFTTGSNTQARRKNYLNHGTCIYGKAITENVWARSHNCEFLCYKRFNPNTKMILLIQF